MNIHLMRFVSVIALSMLAGVAMAVDDATISAIDSKASNANSKADGNNSRIQALEAEDVILHDRIDNIQLTPGPKGDLGPQGVAGPIGPQGSIGLTGSEGPQGSIGLTGSEGPQGPIGLTGSEGPQGPIGLTGSEGPQGPIGLTGSEGPQGPIGLTGSEGPQGPIGLTGSEGPQGSIGLTGSEGPQGPIGLTGSEGPQGPIGLTGPEGPAGADGDSLPVGADLGDILYWDGSVWQLTPAPPVGAATPLTLTLIAGVPTWTETGTGAGVVYAIGDTGPAGGIVFHITDGGLHGLEAAPGDQTSAQWGCHYYDLLGADGTAVGTGMQNTADIVLGCADASTAAKVADANRLGGYNDWFLPSKDELNLLYLQKVVVGGFANDFYWSSSAHDASLDETWSQNFNDGFQFEAYTWSHITLRVRAVRTF